MEQKKLIQFRNIVKDFDGQIVLKGINLDIYENEFVTPAGPQRLRQDDAVCASWAASWNANEGHDASLTDRISPRCRRTSGS